jgi:hypothetical protein
MFLCYRQRLEPSPAYCLVLAQRYPTHVQHVCASGAIVSTRLPTAHLR